MATTATRGRGRPRTFDEEAVLDALTTLFWQQGYEGTSVADIAEAAGLNKSSLYNTFGSKQELFTRVLDRYITARTDMLEALAAETGSGIAALHAFLELLRVEAHGEMGSSGCMAVNTTAELGGDAPEMAGLAEHYRARMKTAVGRLIEQAAATGEIDPTQVENHTRLLVTFMLGMSVTMRSGAGPDELDAIIDAAHANVDSWRA